MMRIYWNTTICSCLLALSLQAASGFAPKRRVSTTNLLIDSASLSSSSSSSTATALGMRVAYQGEPGAYSEKSTRELLGDTVVAIGRPDFESCFRAVASMECDYACLPIENSLGGSIHENYDLMLRYDLTICAEHEFRVQHCVLAKKGVKLDQIKYAISHPQALAQVDNYLRGFGITPIPTYDTAGSAKMISENDLPDRCTPENTCAIASDLAGVTYGLNCLAKGVEDDDTNFTRFLLLGRKGVLQHLTRSIPSKTSVVFTLSNATGSLYKALASFSLRDIDCSKIESRPTSASLLNYLKFRSAQSSNDDDDDKKKTSRDKTSLPRFRYCFYLDFLSGQLDANTENALSHLREQADYVRILGSYPQRSRLVGPVLEAAEELKTKVVDPGEETITSLRTLPSDSNDLKPLRIGMIGFGKFGQFLAARMTQKHKVSCMDQMDKSSEARNLGVKYYPHFDSANFFKGLDIVILSVPMIDFDETLTSLSKDKLAGKLIVDVCPLNVHPRTVMLKSFADSPDIDILCTNPMFGPVGKSSEETMIPSATNELWEGHPMVYERVRVADMQRCDRYLKIFEEARCQVVEMAADQHDSSTADAEFVTHMVGRLLDRKLLPPTPVMSKEYAALCEVADMTSGDSLDLFFGMYKYNDRAKEHLTTMRENLASVECQLAAREAYLAAKAEFRKSDRQRLLAETRMLLQELAKSGIASPVEATKAVESKVTKKVATKGSETESDDVIGMSA